MSGERCDTTAIDRPSKFRCMLSNSLYVSKLRKSGWIFLAALALAAVCTLITYPGVWYSDSYARVSLAGAIWDNIKASWRGTDVSPLSSWLTIVPSIFMAASKALTGNMALYTLGQAFAYFSALFLFIKRVAMRWLPAQYLLFALCPLIYGASVYYEASIGCLTGILLILLVFFSSRLQKTPFDRACDVVLLVVASFVVFGYRANALTVAPILLVYAFVYFEGAAWKAASIGAIIIGLFLALMAPSILTIKTMSSSSAGLVWEMLETIKTLEPNEYERYTDYLDDIGGEGATLLALEASTEGSVNPFLGTPLNRDALSAEGASTVVLRRYAKLAMEHPHEFLKTKLKFSCLTMGITRPVANAEYNYNRWDRMAEFNFNDSSARHRFVDSYTNFNDLTWFLRCPWLMFLIGIVLLALERVKPQIGFSTCFCIFLTAAFYYGAYLVNTQAFELRYFYPSLVLLLLIECAVLLNHLALLPDCLKRYMANRRSRSDLK